MASRSTETRVHKIAGSTSVGNPYGDAMKIYFHIHNFENRRNRFRTGCVKAHGYPWSLDVRYWGECVEMRLCLDYQNSTASSNQFLLHARLHTRTSTNPVTEHYACSFYENRYTALCFREKPREFFLACCDEAGTLTIEVDLEVAPETQQESKQVWYPRLAHPENFASFHLKNPSDVRFVVGPTKKQILTHKHVLETRASELHSLVLTESSFHSTHESKDADIVQIVLPNEDECTFETVLDFIYTGNEPKLDDINFSESMLVQSDRFGCTDLKVFTESVLVEKFLVPSTAARLMVLADSHSCPLLKEEAMELYASDAMEVMKGECWPLIEDSTKLLSELLRYTNIDRCQRSVHSTATTDPQCMNVTSLRKCLEKNNLDVDGSREILVERWKEHKETVAGNVGEGFQRTQGDVKPL